MCCCLLLSSIKKVEWYSCVGRYKCLIQNFLTSESSSQPKNLWGGITKYTDIINTVPDLSAQTTFCKAQRKRSIKRLYRECHESEFLPTHFRGFLDRIWAWKEQHYSKWRNMHSLNAIQNTSSTTKLQL